jgi:Tfp pilus assembly protein PilZ
MVMESCVIISRCEWVKANLARFHFRGAYHGVYVSHVELFVCEEDSFVKGEDYLIFVRVLEVSAGRLLGAPVRTRLLWNSGPNKT